MTQIQVHTSLDLSNLPPYSESNGIPNMMKVYAGNALDVVVLGAGDVTAYSWRGEAGWRAHPNGTALEDDGSYHRLILGAALEPTLRYVCFISNSSPVPMVYAAAIEY